jgi:ribosome-associated protein
MNSEIIRDLAMTTLDEMKGIDIVSMDVHALTSIADYMIICSGRSTRHVKALADSVAVKAKEAGLKCVRTEGERESEWVLVDLGDVVVHVMLPTTRSFYSLEDLWQPVKDLREQQSSP